MTVVLVSIALAILLAVAAWLFLAPKYTRLEWIATQRCEQCGEALNQHSLQLADVQWREHLGRREWMIR